MYYLKSIFTCTVSNETHNSFFEIGREHYSFFFFLVVSFLNHGVDLLPSAVG